MKRVSLLSCIMFFAIIAIAQGDFIHHHVDSFHLNAVKTLSVVLPRTLNNEQMLPQNYYTQHLGFFCRQELKMQQAKVPITFRVGTMEQCNKLEQKPGFR